MPKVGETVEFDDCERLMLDIQNNKSLLITKDIMSDRLLIIKARV